ncbi:MAG: hypothetical protein KIT79_09600 [Deltaproteobacteria bacterium]|nr:hypothetical protein [Deltaproteobacteria bacterium]
MARRLLIVFLVISLCLLAAETLVTDAAMSVSGVRGSDRQFWLVYLALIGAPYLLAVVLLLSRKRGYGNALAGGTAATAIVALGPFSVLTVIFAGFTLGNRDQIWTIFLLVLFVLAQIPVTVLSIVEWRKPAPSERPDKALPVGVLGPVLYALILFAGGKEFIAYGDRRTQTALSNQSQTGTVFSAVVDCLNRHRSINPQAGYPATLDELAAGGSPCASPDLLKDSPEGYEISYWSGVKPESGPRGVFSLCAAPRKAWKTGYQIYVADEIGALNGFSPRPEDADRWSCTDVWRSEPRRLIKHCAVRFASDRGTYPASLSDLGPAGSGCLTVLPDGREARIEGDWYSGSRGEAVQFVTVRNSFGNVNGFEIHWRQSLEGRDVYWMSDESGRVHVSASQRAARSDPSPAELMKQFEAEAHARAGEIVRLESACGGGSLADCDRLALKTYEPTSPSRAEELWVRACNGGLLRSCLFVPPARRDKAMWHLVYDRQECETQTKGECPELDRMAERDRNCRQGNQIQCREAAYDWEYHRDRDHANDLWKSACESGDRESCYLFQVRDIEYAQVLGWKKRCRNSEKEPCEWLARRVKDFR